MMALTARKMRIYPNKEQEQQINRTFGCCRFVFNHFLALQMARYEAGEKHLRRFDVNYMITTLKNEKSFLKEVDSTALTAVSDELNDAYSRMFRKRNRHPRFRKKNSSKQSYTSKYVNGNIKVSGNGIKLPKLGRVNLKNSFALTGDEKMVKATISKTSTGKYYVSVLLDIETVPHDKTGKAVGVDAGILDFLTLSDETRYENMHFSRKRRKRLAREQRKLSRRRLAAEKDGRKLSESKNYQKQKLKVAKLHEKTRNQRNDYIQKISTEIVKNHDIVGIEDLNVKGLMKNRRLAFAFGEISLSGFHSMLEYKASRHDRRLVKVGRWFASSQLCSNCGCSSGKKPLNVRGWMCPDCGLKHDRDVNAAKNILNETLRILSQSDGCRTVGTTAKSLVDFGNLCGVASSMPTTQESPTL